MKISSFPKNEVERIAALQLFQILDTEAERDFDDITTLAAQICETPFSLITLIDKNRQWFKAKHGIALAETHRDISFCAHAIHEPDIMVITDTSKDERFFDNPFVAGDPEIRFYAGMPLITESGFALGTLCVLDQKPRELTPKQLLSLKILANQVLALLKLRIKISDFESKLDAYFKSTSNAVCFIDPAYKVIAYNKIFEKNSLLYFNKKVNINDCIPGFIDQENEGTYKAYFTRAMAGEEIQIETLIKTAGKSTWWCINYIPVRNTTEDIIGVVFNAADIDKWKKAEEKLAENQRFLQTLINNLPGYVYRVKNDPTYTPEYISEGVTKITGHTPNDYTVDRIISGAHSISEIDKDRLWKQIQTAIKNKLPYEFNYRMKDKSGGEKWVWERGQGIWNEDGGLVALEGFITDINDYKNAEAALQKSEDNLHTVFENTEVGYILFNDQLQVLSFNKPAQQFNQNEYQKTITAGMYFSDFIPHERWKELKEVLQPISKGKIVEYDRNILRPNGEEHWYHIKYSPVSNKEKKTTGVVMSLENITERKIAEIDLLKSFNLVSGQNKRLLNFSYIVSHNLRSHATNIKSILGLMEEPASQEERHEMLQHLKTVSNSLDESLHNLNEVISIQNNINLIFEPLSLYKYIVKAMDVLSEQIAAKNAIIENNVDPAITVNYNPAYLESIILNFLSNALKYSHPSRQPVISFNCTNEHGKLLLKIADNGIGIDLKRNGDKLFGMYKTFNGNADAKGIGLFISKNQIDFMGGKVEAESQLNIGSTFKIYFK